MTSSKFQSLMMIILCLTTISSKSFSIFNDLIKNSPKFQNQQIHQVQNIDQADKKENLADVSQSGNLKFTNYTGSEITSDMVTNYIKIINNAYSFFGSNLNSTTDYISKQLQTSYGWAYNVVILLANQTTQEWVIYNIGASIVVWSKVNSVQSNWTYIIWPVFKYSSQTTNYISKLGRGSGIDTQKENVIRNIVRAQQDKYSTCMCSLQGMQEISDKLEKFDGLYWSVICKKLSSISFNSLLKTNNNQYIQLFIYTHKCEYLLAAN